MKVKKLLVSTVAAVCLFGTVTAFAASASMDGGYAYLNARYSNRLRECDAGTIRNNESDYASLYLRTNYMKKKTLICLAFLLLLSGCDNKNEQVSDEKISVPETLEQISSTNGKTTWDYGNKNMLEGFWVKENVSGGDKWYKYIHMLPEKLAGIYDFEDAN